MTFRALAAASVVGVALSSALACGDDRPIFSTAPADFGPTAPPDAGCPNTCSLDGRAVVRCTGEVVERCPDDLACGGGRCQGQCAAAAAAQSSNGCGFYLQSPRLIQFEGLQHSCFAAFIVNTSTKPAEIGLEYEGKALDLSRSLYQTTPGEATLRPQQGPILPGEGAILFVSDRPKRPDRPSSENYGYIACPEEAVPALVHEYAPRGSQIGSSFHLTTNVPVSAASIYPFGGAMSVQPTATLLLPVSTWTKENILVNAWSQAQLAPPGAQIVAADDDTEITIVPRRAIQDGYGVKGGPAGVPAHYRLNRGQFLQLVQPEELTGSVLTSTKPTTIFAGHSCANVPTTTGACDILSQQIPGYPLWGSEYVGVGYRPRRGNEHESVPYRIIAARDGTRLDYDPEVPRGAPLTLNAGEVAAFAAGTGEAFVVRSQDSEHPFYVAAYMTGVSGDYWGGPGTGTGDPEFVNVVPTEQYLSRASFYADPTYADTSLVIVRAKSHGEFKDVTLGCLGGPIPNFRPIGTRGDYEFTRVNLSTSTMRGDSGCYYGTHHLASDGPFTATIWGWDITASYAYASGTATRRLVEAPLPR
ncbi:MAG: hypothetical protein K0S65_1199 [Labilithrix sp.]|nr:hypothetical protein [Labilithrix sp.]